MGIPGIGAAIGGLISAGWVLVGVTTAQLSSASNVTLPGPPAEGDIVIVAQACDTFINPPNTAGYTQIASSGASDDPAYELHYKVMSSSPDTVVNIDGSVTQQNAVAVQVWRGVDTGTPLDGVTPTTATGGSGLPNAPSITPATDKALVFAFGALDNTDAGAATAPSGFSNFTKEVSGSGGTNGATVFLSSKVVDPAAAMDPDAYGGLDTDLWFACSFCLRPGF